MAEKTYQLQEIRRVHFAALGNVRLIQDDQEFVLVEGSEEALEHVKVNLEAGELSIQLYTWYDFLFLPRPASYTIHVKSIEKFSIAGSAEMDCDALDLPEKDLDLSISGSARMRVGRLNCRELHISSSGSGKYIIQAVTANQVKAEISGSGDYRLEGQCHDLALRISGSGGIEAADLACAASEVHISGSGRITTNPSEKLEVHISGSGEVIYSGDPQVNHHISGSGKVWRR